MKESVFKRTQRKIGFPVKKTDFRKAVRKAREILDDNTLSQAEALGMTRNRTVFRPLIVDTILYGNS